MVAVPAGCVPDGRLGVVRKPLPPFTAGPSGQLLGLCRPVSHPTPLTTLESASSVRLSTLPPMATPWALGLLREGLLGLLSAPTLLQGQALGPLGPAGPLPCLVYVREGQWVGFLVMVSELGGKASLKRNFFSS